MAIAEEQLKLEAQEALDELWIEHGIPFKLTAHQVEASERPDYYQITFYDSRAIHPL